MCIRDRKYTVPKKKICNYKGQGGWDFIQNSGLCFNDLKKINKSKFKSVKAVSYTHLDVYKRQEQQLMRHLHRDS